MKSELGAGSREKGIGVIGLIFVIALAVTFMKVGFTLGPIYWNHYKALGVIKRVIQDPATSARSAAELRSSLQRYWDIEDISNFTPGDIKVKKVGSGRAFAIDYEVKEPLFREISVVVHFVEEIPVPGGTE